MPLTSCITMSVSTRLKVFSLEGFERFAAAAGQLDGVALALERGGDHGADRGFVVDDENARRFALTCAAYRREGRWSNRVSSDVPS